MKENLKLWESVEKTDPAHTKKANVKGNNITSIKPQYQIYQATKQWGSYGIKWGFKSIHYDTSLVDVNGLMIFKAVFYYPNGEFETINTISIWRDGAMTKPDDEWAKKVETDTLTKSLSKLGFNADIFMGRFDDLRYVEQMRNEFRISTSEEKEALLKISQAKSIEDLTKIKIEYKNVLNLIKGKLTEKYNDINK
jgi:hypothetical protein